MDDCRLQALDGSTLSLRVDRQKGNGTALIEDAGGGFAAYSLTSVEVNRLLQRIRISTQDTATGTPPDLDLRSVLAVIATTRDGPRQPQSRPDSAVP